MRSKLVILIVLALASAGCSSSPDVIPPPWLTPLPAEAGRSVMQSGRTTADVQVVRDARGARLVRNGVDLTEPFAEIESFDVSLDRQEVAFSARREKGLDIGLVHLEGSPISWVPEDPGDEEQVRWAPRGNKISYFIRSPGGDLIRTVHIPTAVALTIDFPFSVLRSLEWDAAAERFTVVADSPDASARTEVMRYGGEERRVTVAPAVQLDVELIPLAGRALLLQPKTIRYDETLPVIVWVTGGRRNSWNPRRGELMRKVRAAAVVTDATPDETLWTAIGQLAWADRSRIFVVDASAKGASAHPGAFTIFGDPSVPAGHFRRGTNSAAVQPADVESFAAGFIAEQLKGTPPRGH